MPLTVPAWIAAIATAVIAVGVTVLAGLAGNALGARSRQVADQRELISQLAEALTLQVKDLRLSMDERRRAQACQVFIELTRPGGPATPPTGQVTATVHNNSQQPVYSQGGRHAQRHLLRPRGTGTARLAASPAETVIPKMGHLTAISLTTDLEDPGLPDLLQCKARRGVNPGNKMPRSAAPYRCGLDRR